MKFEMKYSSKFKQIAYFIACACYAAVFAFLPVLILYVISDLLFAILFGAQQANDFARIFLVCEIMVFVILYLKCSRHYVQIDYRGVKIGNHSFVHYGITQPFHMNALIPFERIVSCKSGIPVDCPPNYRYQRYNGGDLIQRRRDLKAGREVEYMKEPAIAGGRFDEECILLELDNKRIVVIPIDECNEFLELFNQYFEQYKELRRKKEREHK